MRYQFELDDIDRLFSRLEPAEGPDDMSARVIAMVASRARRRRRIGVAAIAVSLLLLATASFFVGQHLASSGALLLLEGVALGPDLVGMAPIDAALAALDLIPWFQLGFVVLGLAILGVAGHRLAHPPVRVGQLHRLGGIR